MFCVHCGREIADDSVFCEFCGEKVAEESSVSPVENPSPAAAEKKSRKATIIGVVAVLLVCSLVGGGIWHFVGGSGPRREKEVGELVEKHNDGCLMFGILEPEDYYDDDETFFVFTDCATYNDDGDKYTVYYGDLVKYYNYGAVRRDYLNNHSSERYEYNGQISQYIREVFDEHEVYDAYEDNDDDYEDILSEAEEEIYEHLDFTGQIFDDGEIKDRSYSYWENNSYYSGFFYVSASSAMNSILYVVEPNVRLYVYEDTGVEKHRVEYRDDKFQVYSNVDLNRDRSSVGRFDAKLKYSDGSSEKYSYVACIVIEGEPASVLKSSIGGYYSLGRSAFE